MNRDEIERRRAESNLIRGSKEARQASKASKKRKR